MRLARDEGKTLDRERELGEPLIKQAKRLKSRQRRPEVNRLVGRWSIGSYQISYAVK